MPSIIIRGLIDATNGNEYDAVDRLMNDLVAGTRTVVSSLLVNGVESNAPMSGLAKVSNGVWNVTRTGGGVIRVFDTAARELVGGTDACGETNTTGGSVSAMHQRVFAFSADAILYRVSSTNTTSESVAIRMPSGPRHNGVTTSAFAGGTATSSGTTMTIQMAKSYSGSTFGNFQKYKLYFDPTLLTAADTDPVTLGISKPMFFMAGVNQYGDRSTANRAVIYSIGLSGVPGDTITDGSDIWDFVYTSILSGAPSVWLRRT